MGALFVQLFAVFGMLVGFAATAGIIWDRRKLRANNAAVEAVNGPWRCQREAEEMAQHALEHDLPTMPWYQLAAFWGRVTGDEPEIIRPEIHIVTGRPEPEQPAEADDPHENFDLEAFVARTARRVQQAQDEALREVTEAGRRYHDPAMQRQAELRRAGKALERGEPPLTKRISWKLKGTEEDGHVVDALFSHGIVATVRDGWAEAVGPVSSIHAAEAVYRVGWQQRRREQLGPAKMKVGQRKKRMGL